MEFKEEIFSNFNIALRDLEARSENQIFEKIAETLSAPTVSEKPFELGIGGDLKKNFTEALRNLEAMQVEPLTGPAGPTYAPTL